MDINMDIYFYIYIYCSITSIVISDKKILCLQMCLFVW